MNWKVRINNPVWWFQVISAIFLPILTYFGLKWQDITSWSILGDMLLKAISNPCVILLVLLSVWNACNDPTTKGLKDSERAMTYTEPN